MGVWLLGIAVAAADPLVLSYAEALERGLAHNPTLALADQDLRAADGALLAARGVFDPNLEATLGLQSSTSEGSGQLGEYSAKARTAYNSAAVSWLAPTGTTLSLGWDNSRNDYRYVLANFDQPYSDAQFGSGLRATVSQALLEGWRMSYNLAAVRQATQNHDLAEIAAQSARQQTMADVASAYWTLWYTRKQVAIAESAVGVAEEESRIVRARVEAGALAQVERSRADALVVEAQSALITARNAARAASDDLLLLLGETPGADVTLNTEPAEPAPLSLDEAALVSTALERNPDLAALRLAEDAATQDQRDTVHARLPQLDASASYGLTGYDPTLSGSISEMASGDFPEWSVGASLSLPLGNRIARGQAMAADADLTQARLEREAYERTLTALIRAQVATLESSSSQLQLAQANARLADETLAAERALQSVGRAVQRDVLDAIKGADTARLAVEKARADYALAVVQLEQLKGTL